MDCPTGKLSDLFICWITGWITFWAPCLADALPVHWQIYNCLTNCLTEWMGNWLTGWLVYWLTGCWVTCSLDAEQINFKECSSFSGRELKPISRRKTNYYQEPGIHVVVRRLDSSSSSEYWLHCSAGADLLAGLQMRLKPALFCSNITILRERRDERQIGGEVMELLTLL